MCQIKQLIKKAKEEERAKAGVPDECSFGEVYKYGLYQEEGKNMLDIWEICFCQEQVAGAVFSTIFLSKSIEEIAKMEITKLDFDVEYVVEPFFLSLSEYENMSEEKNKTYNKMMSINKNVHHEI